MLKFGVENFLETPELIKTIKKEYDITKFSDQIRKVNSELDILEEMMSKDFNILKAIRNDLKVLDDQFSILDDGISEFDKIEFFNLVLVNLPKGVYGEIVHDDGLYLKLILNNEVIGNMYVEKVESQRYAFIKMNNKNNGEYRSFLMKSEKRIYKIILYIYFSIYGTK